MGAGFLGFYHHGNTYKLSGNTTKKTGNFPQKTRANIHVSNFRNQVHLSHKSLLQTGQIKWFMNTRGDELNFLRLFEIIGFIIVIIGLVLFWVYTVVKHYPLTEIYPIYIIWIIGMLLLFVMRHYRKKQ